MALAHKNIIARSLLAIILAALLQALHPAPAFAGVPETLVFRDSRQLESISGALYTPEGDGPFPAVVLLHGCAGVQDYHHEWAARFIEWGYSAFVVDSLGPRNVKDTCENPFSISPELRQLDALGALQLLRQRPDIIPDRVAVAGWSHGGWTALKAVSKNGMWRYTNDLPGGTFKTAVTFYPWCTTAAYFVSPVLILAGDKDTLTPSKLCEDLLPRKHENSANIELTVYPGAFHLFDSGLDMEEREGYMMGGDEPAKTAAIVRVKGYLAENL